MAATLWRARWNTSWYRMPPPYAEVTRPKKSHHDSVAGKPNWKNRTLFHGDNFKFFEGHTTNRRT